ncbi:MAG: hypothetical protein L0287_36885 [Anaerolineae bacterium]|nr:hypothetical protein [Anaerolineae bacterium]MCI0608532.1 hypothetical protein [Anaerolineae bacterium]
MSLTGRSTCASASALSLDAQPAQVERVVRRISRPVLGIGINLFHKATVIFAKQMTVTAILLFVMALL